MPTFTRRPHEAGKKTYWLDVNHDGFLRVHTADMTGRKLDPQFARLAALVEHAPELIRDLVAIIDEELLPNAGKLALQDYARLNDTLIAARQLLGE